MRRARNLYKLLIAATLVAVIGVAPAAAIESFGVGALPVNPKPDNPRTKSIFVHEVQPGNKVNDAIRIVNNSKEEKTISVYPVDSELSSDGAFACKQAVDPKKNVGSWIKLSESEVKLKPNTNVVLPFTIDVPQSASVGEHNGCIAVQDMKKNEATGNGIVLSFRSALRVVVMVPGEVKASLSVKDVKINLANKLLVSPVLHNAGNVSLDTQVKVEVKSIFGFTVADGGGKFPILRDTTSQFNIELDKPFWGGWYSIGGDATYEILQTSGKKNAASAPVPFPSEVVFVAPQPIALAVELGVLLLILVATSFTVWRLWRNKQLHTKALNYRVSEGDDLEMIAQKYAVRWQLIARLNGLKPPYKLHPGQQLKIPKK